MPLGGCGGTFAPEGKADAAASPADELPYLRCPLHAILKLTPVAYGTWLLWVVGAAVCGTAVVAVSAFGDGGGSSGMVCVGGVDWIQGQSISQ